MNMRAHRDQKFSICRSLRTNMLDCVSNMLRRFQKAVFSKRDDAPRNRRCQSDPGFSSFSSKSPATSLTRSLHCVGDSTQTAEASRNRVGVEVGEAQEEEQRPWKRYSLDVLLAKGSYGIVWKSFDSVRQEVVALKVMNLTKHHDSRDNCEMEDQYWRGLDHENIVQWKSTHVAANLRVTAMQYCNGGDLYEVAPRPFDESAAVHVIESILKALLYLHTKANVTHRDVKQENVLIHYADLTDKRTIQRSRILLADFTFVAPISPSLPYKTAFFDLCGTLDYIAPEIVIARRYTAKVDCWALGVLAFELLQGTLPYNVDFDGRIPEAIFAKRRPITRPMTDSTTNVISALLCKNVDERATAAEALNILLSKNEPQLSPLP